MMSPSENVNPYPKALPPIVLLLLAGVLLVSACGKKGPPIPPRAVAPPAVGDLAEQIQGDQVTLTWSAPKGKRRATAGLAGFFVYRSKTAATKEECKDCPVFFTRVATVSYTDTEDPFTYVETLDQGFRYIYKVNVFGTGLVSGDSNLVEFTY